MEPHVQYVVSQQTEIEKPQLDAMEAKIEVMKPEEVKKEIALPDEGGECKVLPTKITQKQIIQELDKKLILQHKQRNRKKSWTYIYNLPLFGLSKEDIDKFAKKLSKVMACGATVKNDEPKEGLYIQLQGDHRVKIQEYLINKTTIITDRKLIVMKG